MITASIVTYKSKKEELDTLFKCVLDSSIDHIYIVDNSPTKELQRYAQLSSKIEYIFGHGNIGYGSAHNIAIRKSINLDAKYHIVINPDIYFEKGTIEGLEQFMDQNNNTGQIMPKILFPNGNTQYICKLSPTPTDWILRRFSPFKNLLSKRNERFELRKSNYTQILNVPFLSGCFMMFRISALKDVGLFDSKIFMYCEDADITRRIHKKYSTIFYPHITIYHAHQKASHKNYKLLIIHIKSTIYYFNKWGWFFDKDRKEINRQVLSSLQ